MRTQFKLLNILNMILFIFLGCEKAPPTNQIERKFFKKGIHKDAISVSSNNSKGRYLIDGTTESWQPDKNKDDEVQISISNVDLSQVNSIFITNSDILHPRAKKIRFRFIIKIVNFSRFDTETATVEYETLLDEKFTLSDSLIQEIKVGAVAAPELKGLGTIEISVESFYEGDMELISIAELDFNAPSSLRPSAKEFIKNLGTNPQTIYLVRGDCPVDQKDDFRSLMTLQKSTNGAGLVDQRQDLGFSYERTYGSGSTTTEKASLIGKEYSIIGEKIVIAGFFKRGGHSTSQSVEAELHANSPCKISINLSKQKFSLQCATEPFWSEYKNGYVYWP